MNRKELKRIEEEAYQEALKEEAIRFAKAKAAMETEEKLARERQRPRNIFQAIKYAFANEDFDDPFTTLGLREWAERD